mgnify:CR=1 FL=1
MTSTPNPSAVRHLPTESRFEITVDGLQSVVDYTRAAGEMVLTHTYVPAALRGRGLAEQLVRAALEFARTEKVQVVPSCSYVATFIARHPEFQPLLKR